MVLPKIIYIMGPPGGGKGTQAELLAQKLGYVQFSTGDAFRRMRKEDTPLGRKVKERYDMGLLQTPELAAEVVIAAVKNYVADGEGLIFDGTPRTIKESEMIDDFFEKEGLGRPLAIFLKVDREEMINRITKRKYCLGISQMFPVLTNDERKKCEAQGGTVGIRPDDSKEELETRWDETVNQTFPVVEKYRLEGILHEVDGMAPIAEVQKQVNDVIGKFS